MRGDIPLLGKGFLFFLQIHITGGSNGACEDGHGASASCLMRPLSPPPPTLSLLWAARRTGQCPGDGRASCQTHSPWRPQREEWRGALVHHRCVAPRHPSDLLTHDSSALARLASGAV